ncbi:hypothetical protein AALP_AA2G043600 [Arabis alpina]|uniref:Uncharacterized protein n=1 Tax=Arabis alpina TaxID=50452 RepID=A0A087HFA6_ARAAL|nr:hypothetical protein AALP_AA2G043600 [Arabis alpina]
MPQNALNSQSKPPFRNVPGGRGNAATGNRGKGIIGGREKAPPRRRANLEVDNGAVVVKLPRDANMYYPQPVVVIMGPAATPFYQDPDGGASGARRRLVSKKSVRERTQGAEGVVSEAPPLVESDYLRGLEEEEEEDYNMGIDMEDMEDEDEVDAPNQEDQDYDELLDNLMRFPGREQLKRLSQHPIPPLQSIWYVLLLNSLYLLNHVSVHNHKQL